MRRLLLTPVVMAVMAASAYAESPDQAAAAPAASAPAAPVAPVPAAAPQPPTAPAAPVAQAPGYAVPGGQQPVYAAPPQAQGYPAAQYPAQYPQGQYPQGQYPQAQGYPAAQYPQGQYPAQTMPGGQAAQPPSPADLAFQQALQSLMPMTPEQVRQYKQIVDKTQSEIAAPVGAPPKPVSRSVTLSLKPGEQSPKLRLYPGNATTITFSDISGAPWPVMSVTVGNPTAYQAGEAGEKGKTNIVVISPLTNHAQANNLVVTLKDNPVPLTFSLETGTSEVDYRVDVGLQTRGPNAAYDIVSTSSLPPTGDATAKKVGTSSRIVEAWRYNDMVYVRTPLEVLSPAYVGRARNVSGVNVYTMIDSPVVLVSQDGRMASVTIER